MSRDRTIADLFDRKPDAHKGDFGRVLIVGGSAAMPGAVALAGLSALRAGAGLVKIACPSGALQTVLSVCPCATGEPLKQTTRGLIARSAIDQITRLAEHNDVVAVGPGMGTSSGGAALVAALTKLPDRLVVIDADGLNNLATLRNWPRSAQARLVLTPHPGEMRRLVKAARLDLDPNDRQECCAAFARHTRQIVVLKGAATVVSDGSRTFVNSTGNPGMATGGSGDVLTGIIAALVAQGLDPFDAACLGVHLHGLAGDIAAESTGQLSLIATDLINFLPPAFVKLAAHPPPPIPAPRR